MSKVRIIHIKTGEVKWVSPHVARDTKQLKSYGYKVQDLGEKKEVEKEIDLSASETIDELEKMEVENDVYVDNSNSPVNEITFDDLVDEQPTIERKKPGPKPKTTVTE